MVRRGMQVMGATISALIVIVAVSLVVFAGGKSGSGNPPNTFGLCTAAANGEKNGWNNQPSGAPKPFQPLVSQGESVESSSSDAEGAASDARSDISMACSADGVTPGGGGHQ